MWHRRLGARLAEARGRRVEVVNLGVPAVGPRFSLAMFEVEAAARSGLGASASFWATT
jgi:hypothetical protein